jgi:RNA polymerase sigma-70 factor (ECF subfamily)
MVDRPSDGELLGRTAAGDREAFSELYLRYEVIVAAFVMRRVPVGAREVAADLTAETFAQAIASAGRFRDEGHGALAWLLGIAGNLVSQSARRRGVELRCLKQLGIDRVGFGDASLERVEALIDLDALGNPFLQALGELPASQREAVRRHVLGEMPYRELAAAMQVSEVTVRQRVSRGLSRLRSISPEGPQ